MLRWQIHEVLSELDGVESSEPHRTLTYLSCHHVLWSEWVLLLVEGTIQVKTLSDLLVILQPVYDSAEDAVAGAGQPR